MGISQDGSLPGLEKEKYNETYSHDLDTSRIINGGEIRQLFIYNNLIHSRKLHCANMDST